MQRGTAMIGISNIVALRHGAMTCRLAPDCGGSVASWTKQGAHGLINLFRPASFVAESGGSATDMACFPLVPFSNRIAGGRFTFQGRAVTLPPNLGFSHAIHGHGWTAPWTVDERSDRAAQLSYHHPAGAWPWRYSAVQTIALDDDGLVMTLDLINESDSAMPAGLGLHPYFPKPPGTRVTAGLTGMWESDGSVLPRSRHPLPTRLDFPAGLAMDDSVILDHGFTGWNGQATVRWSGGVADGTSVSLLADGPFGHLIVYAPAVETFLCLEPVSHMTDAVNHPEEVDAGVFVLAPGERLSGTVRFRVSSP